MSSSHARIPSEAGCKKILHSIARRVESIQVVRPLPCSSYPGFSSGIISPVGNRSYHLGSERPAMTSKATILTKRAGKLERFPDFPPREDMQNTSHLHRRSILTALAIHIGNPETTLVHGEVPVAPTLDPWEDYRIPDLIVTYNCDVTLVDEQRGYAIDRQGKAPDFVLEVASRSTGRADYTDKRADYERYGISEYWRFDPSGGEYHDAALAGDRLVDGRYEPIAIETLQEGILRGYSDALGLYVCWEDGRLRFFDPGTESYLRSHDEERAESMATQARAEEERTGRLAAQSRAAAAEARAAELESELRRLRGE